MQLAYVLFLMNGAGEAVLRLCCHNQGKSVSFASVCEMMGVLVYT